MISLSRFPTYILVLAVLLLTLTACGGSEGGIGGSGISNGVIEEQTENGGKKTTTVNGVQFDTTNATFTEEGASTSAANFQSGMVVVVQGSIDANGQTGTASSMAYADLLEGPISNINIAGNTITAMAQTIIVDAATRYSGGVSALADLMNGDVIEVSGFFTAEGFIYATFVEKILSSEHELKGVITALTPMSGFSIGNLEVNWPTTAGLNVGDFVKAEGSMNGANTLIATSVSNLSQHLAVADADTAEVEGLATTACTPITPPCTFQLGFITVQIGTNTQYEGGILTDLQPGTRLEAEGRLQNNIVIAERIRFKDKVEIISDVSSLDSMNSTFDLEYGNTDVTVTYDPIISKLDSIANFADIQNAGHVKVRARVAGNRVVAIRIENSRGNKDLALQGTVSAASNPNITVLGVTINTNSNGLKLKDRTGLEITQTQFFSQVNSTSLVKAKGEIDAEQITWKELKIEQ